MFELVIHYGGTAVLTEAGKTVWTSDADEEFMAEFDDTVTIDDADDILIYLEDAGVLEDGADVDVVEASEDGLSGPGDDEEDDDDDDDDGFFE